jgi:DNA replication protein DnaC
MTSDMKPIRLFERVRQLAAANAGRTRGPDSAARAAAALAEARAAFEARRDAEALENLMRSGVGEDEARRVAAGLEDWEARKVAQAFWDSADKRLLLLYGHTGTGKTHAAAELITRCRFHFRHPDFGDTWEWPSVVSQRGRMLSARVLSTRSFYGEEAQREDHRLRAYRLLVIDELGGGGEIVTPAWVSCLEGIIIDRHREGLKTVLLTNCDAATFKHQYGERIARRIREDGTAVNLGSKSLSAPTKLKSVRGGP